MKLFIHRTLPLAAALFLSGLTTLTAAPTLPSINTGNIFNVTNYGANVASADNAGAIQSAINAATVASGGGTVEVPAGIFLSGPLTLKSRVNLQLDAGAILRMLPYGTYPTNGTAFITASSSTDVEISGAGAIDGQGAAWWPNYKTITRPRMISFQSCNRQLIQDVTLSNSPMFHLAFSSSQGNITVRGVTIFSPPSSGVANPSHNTDACDVSGTNILVENCNISVGDDDFTCGGNTADVLLTNNTYGAGHGVSIGSYTSGGVSNLTVINCTFNGTDNGIRIKSQRGRGGLVQDIKYLNLTMTNVGWPLLVYGYYEYGLGTLTYVNPVFAATTAATNATPLTGTTPIFHDITFSNIVATAPAGRPPLMVWGLPEAPASNIVFQDVHITSAATLAPGIYNATNIQFIDCSFAYPAGVKTMQTWNADVIFSNSAASAGLYQLDGLTTNGLGNAYEFHQANGALQNTNALGTGPLTLDASIFTVSNNLTLFPATVLNFTLSTNATTLAVTGNLALGGTVNLAAGPGFAPGIYTIMTCVGAVSGTFPVLGSTPAGYNFAFDTNTPDQVRLNVTSILQNPPPAPTNLVATATNGAVSLSWSPAATATGYYVKRSTTSGSGYMTNATVGGTGYTDTQVTDGTTYFYVVSAFNAAGASADSAVVSATPQTPAHIVVTTNVFNETFTGSMLNSASPSAPTASGTSYQIISTKSWNPPPSLTGGNLRFGIGATSSGVIEAQARFAVAPVTLATPGDAISLAVTFTNEAGLLTGAGTLGFGLYNSGQNDPVPGGLNGTATTGFADHGTGNAQTWAGYVGQLAYTGGSCRIMTRPAQMTGALFNNAQDLVSSGSSSSSFTNDPPQTVGAASSAPSVTLTAGSVYTEVLTITLGGANVLAVTNSLFSGTNTNAAPLSQFGGVAAGGAYLTNAFDALAIGWRETGSAATIMDISRLSVQTTLTVPGTQVSMTPPTLSAQLAGSQLLLAWPADHLGWTLQIQTNNLSGGLGTNWVDVPGSTAVDQMSLPVNPGNGAVFVRLIYRPT